MIKLRRIKKLWTNMINQTTFTRFNNINQTTNYISCLAVNVFHNRSKMSFSIQKFQNDEKTNQNSPEKTSIYFIQNACQQLLQIDSATIDQCCLIFSSKYILRQSIQPQKVNSNDELVLQALGHYLRNKKIDLALPKIYENIKLIFEFLNSSKIGFLRGDLHSKTFFELHNDITQKIKRIGVDEKRKEIQYELNDFKNILHMITDTQSYRLPLQGIRNRSLQSKINLFHRQIILENVSYQISHNKYQMILQSLMKINRVQEAEVVRKFIIQWLVPLTGALKEQQNRCMQKQGSKKRSYAQYLLKLKVQKISYIALTQLIIDLFEHYYKAQLTNRVELFDKNFILQKKYVKRLIKKIQIQIFYEREEQIFKQNQRDYDLILKLQKNHQKHQQPKPQIDDQDMDLQSNNVKASAENDKSNLWKSQHFRQKQKASKYRYVAVNSRKQYLNNLQERVHKMYLGNQIPQNAANDMANLIVYLIKQLIMIENKYGYKVPLLTSQTYIIKRQHTFEGVPVLRFNQHFLGQLLPKLQKDQNPFLHLDYSVPMIIQPLPWVEPQIGGYYSQATTVMRYSNCPVQQRLVQFADNHRVFKILDFLGSIPWKINSQILDIVEAIWAEGTQQNCIPKRYSQLLNPFLSKLKLQTDYTKKKQLMKQIQSLRDQHSLRSNFLLKLNLAQSFKNIDMFYFPHNLDFRGRTYPIPPHINHIGDDLSRGLLSFGIGKKLGSNGLKWLKIHTANLMGKDKATISQKLSFIEQNLQKIKKIGDKPLQNRQWLQYQDCWQAIASIIDLTKALKQTNPQDYISHIHIHQDGSCNGLQHYAALGRDVEGAYQVNLGPSQTPGDIYTHVSKMVSQMIEQDILIQQDAKKLQLQLKLRGNIKRKTIKQTVMTSVYGVTFIGAKQQIHRQLRDQGFLQDQQISNASKYLSQLTLKAISNLFVNAHEIKKWFKECARKITQTGNPIGWISPLGLPIVQPYRKEAQHNIIKTVSHKIQIPKQIQNIPINKSKQISAFPPNFVHSLDSSHMMYTAQECKNRGLLFAAVHDSFWSHPSTVEQMNMILREQFIRLHKQEVLQSLKKTLEQRFPEYTFPQIPKRGNFDLDLIKQSKYFFS